MSYHEYLGDLEEYNKYIKDSQVLYKDWLNKIQDQDEQRVEVIKKSLNGFFNTFSDAGEIIKDKISESISSIELLNAKTDIKIFIDENRSKEEFLKNKEFVSYQYSQKLLEKRKERLNSKESLEDMFDFGRKESVESANSRKSSGMQIDNNLVDNGQNSESFDLLGLNDFESSKEDKKDTDSFNDNKNFVTNAIEGLFQGKEMPPDEQLKVFELLHESYISATLSNHLNSIKSPRKLESLNILKSLAEIIKYLITVSIHDKQNDFDIILHVLGCSQFIYAIDNVSLRKILLTHLIKDHGIWQDISKWILWIYRVIENKRQEFQTRKNSVSGNSEESPQKAKGSRFLGGIKGIAKMVIGKAQSEEGNGSDVITKNVIFNVLSQFIYHFANFGVAPEGGKKLILYF